MNDKTKGTCSIAPDCKFIHYSPNAVDENLYYKGVDKSAVHVARLHQSHSLSEPEQPTPSLSATESNSPAYSETTEDLPTYPFTSGDTLLALTRKHNVCSSLSGLSAG